MNKVLKNLRGGSAFYKIFNFSKKIEKKFILKKNINFGGTSHSLILLIQKKSDLFKLKNFHQNYLCHKTSLKKDDFVFPSPYRLIYQQGMKI